MTDKKEKIEKRSWKRVLFESFKSEEIASEYYKVRKGYFQMIYVLLASGKIGHIVQLVSMVSWNDRSLDERLVRRYPFTEEGDSEYIQIVILHIAENLLGIFLLLLAVYTLKKNVQVARVVNPVIVTLAFLLETPTHLVYTDYYKMYTMMNATASLTLIPWLCAETMAGQLIIFNICYANLIASFHLHFDFSVNPIEVIIHYFVYLFVNVAIINDISRAYKDTIEKKIKIRKQSDEFDTILSSLPQGILLTKLKTAEEK